jgi:hypothetical protein
MLYEISLDISQGSAVTPDPFSCCCIDVPLDIVKAQPFCRNRPLGECFKCSLAKLPALALSNHRIPSSALFGIWV